MPRNPIPEVDPSTSEAGAARLRGAKKRRAVRSRRRDVDTTAHKIGQDRPREMPSTGPARIQPSEVQVVDRPVDKEWADQMEFNEEELTILIHETTNPSDDPVPFVINGGRRQAFIRGREQKVKRKYVEVLARMKVTTYTQEKYRDSQDIDAIRNVPHTALKNPFSVIHDPNPRGHAWLKGILSEA